MRNDCAERWEHHPAILGSAPSRPAEGRKEGIASKAEPNGGGLCSRGKMRRGETWNQSTTRSHCFHIH